MMTKPDPNRCQKRVFSGQRWDYAGHQCTRKPVKDGFCGTHQPDAVDTRRVKAEAKWRKKWNMTMRKSIGASFAPALAEALRQLLDLPLTADRKKIEALLHKYDAEMKQHED